MNKKTEIEVKDIRTYFLVSILLWCSTSLHASSGLQVENLRCEYLADPLGVDKAHPRFSWIITSDKRDIIQSAYRIIVIQNDSLSHEPVWDSGKVASSENCHIRYLGQSLSSQTTYYWKAKIWDQNEGESSWSRFRLFHTGFLHQDTLNAQWIMSPNKGDRSPLFRNTFDLNKPVKSAYVYATAVGLYELYVNGKKADSRIFEPAVTQFTERVLYSVYDVTGLLRDSKNTLGIWMGEGMSAFTSPPENRFANINMKPSHYSVPMLRLELKLNYEDESYETIFTNNSWKCSPSPVIFNNFYGGEDYDARFEQDGWALAGFDDTHWTNVTRGHYDGKISAQLLPPVREGNIYFPVSSVMRDSSTLDFDFGTTIGGYWEIELKGKEGDFVTIRGTEKCGGDSCQKPLTPDTYLYWGDRHTGRFYQRDCYSKFILSGKGSEIYKPRFFFKGFRYLRVHLSNPEIQIKSIKSIETGNSLEKHGEFICSDPYLNRLHRMVCQTFKNNFIQGVPLSNPGSEKYGWTGDVHLFSEAANYSYYLPAFWTKWMQDYPDAQHWAGETGIIPEIVPELRKRKARNDFSWAAAYPLIVWQMYRFYNDRQIVHEHYPSVKKWYGFVSGTTKENIADGIYGDHLIPGINRQVSFSTPGMLRLINTAYWYRVTCLLEKMASLLGETEDARQFSTCSKVIYRAFNGQFYQEEQGTYSENPSPIGFSYEFTSNLVPLQMDLVPPGRKQAVVSFLKERFKLNDYRVFTGILGTKALTDYFQEEDPELLYKIIQNREFPGWGYLLDNLGTSTLNQQWNGKGDFNHAMFGSVDTYLFRSLLGISLDSTTLSHQVKISPFLPDNLDFARGKTSSIFGTVSSSWERCPDGISYTIGIPANSAGVFRFKPFSDHYELFIDNKLIIKNNQVVEKPKWMKDFTPGPNVKQLVLGSGTYQIKVVINKNSEYEL